MHIEFQTNITIVTAKDLTLYFSCYRDPGSAYNPPRAQYIEYGKARHIRTLYLYPNGNYGFQDAGWRVTQITETMSLAAYYSLPLRKHALIS